MHRSDKAVLRLTLGLGLATFLAYGLGLAAPYVVCLISLLVLCKPGPPLPLLKGLITAALLAGLVTIGILMVPLLEHYAVSGLLLTASLLFGLFYLGQRRANPLTMILVMAFTMIPVAGVMEQALVGMLALTLALGFAIGTLVSSLSAALFPDLDEPLAKAAPAAPTGADAARWIALRALVVVMPVFVLALTDPSFYMAAILKSVMLGQQAGETDARSAGRELVGSTLMGAWIALLMWFGLSLHPNLWMLVLWVMAAALWTGAGIFATRITAFRPTFWNNALVTALILLGPAIEDSASGKGVFEASAMRTCLYVGVAFYAWAVVWVLEHWRAARERTPLPHHA
jgi:hypothetical protein